MDGRPEGWGKELNEGLGNRRGLRNRGVGREGVTVGGGERAGKKRV